MRGSTSTQDSLQQVLKDMVQEVQHGGGGSMRASRVGWRAGGQHEGQHGLQQGGLGGEHGSSYSVHNQS